MSLPPLQEYIDSGTSRRKALLSIASEQMLPSSTTGKGSRLDLA